jgi:hypothetical protein
MVIADAGSADAAIIRTQSKSGPTLFTLLPAGAHPNDLVVKAFHAR